MDDGQRAFQSQGVFQLLERQIRLGRPLFLESLALGLLDFGFASRKAMSGFDLSGALALAKQFFNEPQGCFVMIGYFLTSVLSRVIHRQYSFSQIQ